MTLRAARPRGIKEYSEIEELELTFFRGLALLGNIDTNHVPVSSFTDRCDKESVCPELSAPKFFAKIRMALEELPRRNTLDEADQLGWRELWGGTDEIMDVIRVYAQLLEPDAVPLFDF